jgi:hypothetical protein
VEILGPAIPAGLSGINRRKFVMKTLILASAAVLSLGVGSAFAQTNSVGTDQPATTMQAGTAAPSTYAYNSPQGLVERTEAPALPTPHPTPWGAIEAYASDAAGG